MKLFIDGSVDPGSRVGFGAYLLCKEIDAIAGDNSEKIKIRAFKNTSSTRLELEVLIWALSEVNCHKLTIYTDSQNIIKLLLRRHKIEENDYRTNSGGLLGNHILYKTFFQMFDSMSLEFVKVKGHSPKSQRSGIESIFGLVDRASRRALRGHRQAHNLQSVRVGSPSNASK